MRFLAVVLAFLLASEMALAKCDSNQLDLRGDWGVARFQVEVADTDNLRRRGLMNRKKMAVNAGMLFVFNEPHTASFWMKNTLISLDLLFIDETGTVKRIHHLARPGSTDPIPGGDGVKYVLEINGGLSRRFGIVEGSLIRHPSIDPEKAAWPCA